MAKSKAYLFRGVEIRWSCDPALIKDETPAEEMLKFPGGLLDFLKSEIGKSNTVNSRDFAGRTENTNDGTRRGGMGGGLDAGRSIPSSAPIATPFPRPRAAPMNRACAMR